ncbi:hypothetical protein JCM6882_007322 [Rhodosporidiobolus microsporus]
MSKDAVTLSTSNLDLGLLPHGHILHSLIARPEGKDDKQSSDLLIGFSNVDDHHHSVARTFVNCLVGRYANRLPSGETKLESGAKLHLPGANGVCLHGGETGFDTLPWTPLARNDSALFPLSDEQHGAPPPASDPDAPVSEASSLHRIYSPAGADGFPCSLVVEVLTVVLAPKEEKTEIEGERKGKSLGKVKVVMRAKIREDGDEGIDKGTPINLTMHWGFRLDDHKDDNALNHRLYLASDHLVALDDLGLATGKVDKIEKGGEMDFFSTGLDAEHVTIGERYPKDGIDRNFLFNTPPPSLTDPTGSARLASQPQAVLTSPAPSSSTAYSGPVYSLRFASNQPSVQVYTAPSLDGSGPARKAAHGGPSYDAESAVPQGESDRAAENAKQKRGYGKDGAVFLEFHAPVGTVTKAKSAVGGEQTELGQWMEEWAEGRKAREEGRTWEVDTVLKKGEVYENWTEVEVVVL